MGLITYTLAQQIDPAVNATMYQLSYTKIAQSDTIEVSTNSAVKTIWYVLAYDGGATQETVTWSGTLMTLTSANTGVGSLIVVGTC